MASSSSGTISVDDLKKILKDDYGRQTLDTAYFGENSPIKSYAVMFDELAAKIDVALKKYEEHFKRIDSQVTGLTQHWMKVDAAASQYAKTIGATEEGLKRVRHEALKQGAWNYIGLNYNMSTEELVKAQTNYMKGIGRNVKLNNNDLESVAAMTSVYGEQANELLSAFDKMGVMVDGTAKHTGRMFAEAAKSGISLERYANNIKEGLSIANRFNFSNGLKGMEAMAKRAASIRMDMQQVEQFAGNFSTIENAISNSAKLQVLGGNFALGSDALGLLNDSLNDLESLQQRMENFTKGIGVFNKATGEVDISSFNKLRLQEFAKITGQDFGKVMEVARRQAMRGEIDTQLRNTANYASLSDDFKELIMNTATFENGKAGVTVNGKFKELTDITEKDQKILIAESRTQTEDIKSIAKDVRSLLELREGFKKQDENVQGWASGFIASPLKGLTKLVSGMGGLVSGFMVLKFVPKVLSSLLKIISSTLGTVNVATGFNLVKSLIGPFTKNGWAMAMFKAEQRILAESVKSALGASPQSISRRTGKVSDSAQSIFKKFSDGGGKRIFRRSVPRGGKQIINAAGKEYTQVGTRIFNSAGKEVVGAAKTNALRGATDLGKASIGRRGVGRMFKRAAIKTLGKKGATLAAKGAIPVIGSLVSAGFEAYENRDKFKDKATRGSAIGKTAGAGVGAAVGAALGSFAGPIGTIVGGVAGEFLGKHIGGFIGGIQDKRITRNREVVDSQLSKRGVTRKGDYNVSTLKGIDKALQSGEMSDRLRRRLLKQGDVDIVKQIETVKAQKKEAKEDAKDRRVERFNKLRGKDGKKDIKTAYFNVGQGVFSGVEIKPDKAGPKSPRFAPVGPSVKGTTETGKPFNTLFGNRKKVSEEDVNGRRNENKNNSFNFTINGSIDLKTSNGDKFDILNEIRKDPILANNLAKILMKHMDEMTHGGYVPDRK